ncbi:hypothetical protein D0T25_26450 [Duganella sp. BJB488]|uniref:hypothetical protein n=1 Tax=unclassified Duganella TaxID=2636909 RepID=UPI000E3517F5|nr:MULTISPECIES: hypothetical protein [unclassified Duganella]RFP11594.1 hypothetical protein D0T26_24830 [Duganella sp. BJB489]RFP15692.1 hypothetical protein D0T25_26450 [Duganella sp. BJB488]RFP30639.1 hypothetical protein D0T24_27150 [Duganella sp. BJB480]
MKIALIVTDASPLITLAVAGALDTLTLLGVRVVIPDMVRFEVVRHAAKPGAQEFLDWLDINRDKVEIGDTEEYAEFAALLALNPALRTRNRDGDTRPGRPCRRCAGQQRGRRHPECMAGLIWR